LMDNPDAELPEIMEFIKGPDFPTGALIYGSAGIHEAYATGRGRVIVRSRVEIDEEDHRLIVTEIPYQVNKSMLVEAIANLHKDKRVDGITGIRDESSEEVGIRIVIEHRRDVSGQILLNQLYKYSQLQDTCAINMLAIVNGEPKVLGLKSILQHYIAHQEDVETRRVKFDLDKAEREAHIFEGYKIAIDNIDRIIEIIRASMSIPDAKEQLIAEFSLSEAQAQAIVEMTLGRLSGLERQKIEDRLATLAGIIADLRSILADESKLKAIIKEDLLEIRRRYADDRRTELVPVEDEIIYEDLIEKHTCVITMTHAGYIKRQPASTYSAQRRGGKGIIGMTTKEEDFIENVSVASSHSYIMFFTNTGRVYMKKAYQIPEAGRTAKGSNIVNILELTEGEKITSGISVESFGEGEYLIMVTRRGIIKRTLLSEFEYQRRSGKRAIELDEGDELLFVRHTKGDAEIVVASHEGNFVRYREDEVRVMGRSARGVRGIKLSDEDFVTGVALVDESKQLLTVTEGGYGKRTPFEDFRVMLHRGGSGVTGHKISDKTGKLCGIATVDENDDVMMITNEGTIIRTPVSGIPVYSRTAGGVIVMRLSDGASLVNFTRVEREPEDSELEEAEKAEASGAETSSVTPIDFAEAESADTEEEVNE
ncbi:MAG: DNA gyrase subunit A, partial [Clostridia bacterium]|nr:DNA gyrase subunit A [Clostridia bacterium]